MFDDRLYLVTPSSIFRAVPADEIDPARANPRIPQFVQHEELPYGADHRLVQSTVCVTGELLKDGTHLPVGFPIARAQSLALETAHELASVQDEITRLADHQREVEEGIAQGVWSRAVLPRSTGLKGRADQALEHIRRGAIGIYTFAELFFPRSRPNLPWRAALEGALARSLAPDDPFLDQFPRIAGDIEGMILQRNASVHPDANKSVRYMDYELQADDRILAPTIEVLHEAHPVGRTDLRAFLQGRLEQLSEAYELCVAVLCDRNARQHPGFQATVCRLEKPTDARFAWRVATTEPLGRGLAAEQ